MASIFWPDLRGCFSAWAKTTSLETIPVLCRKQSGVEIFSHSPSGSDVLGALNFKICQSMAFHDASTEPVFLRFVFSQHVTDNAGWLKNHVHDIKLIFESHWRKTWSKLYLATKELWLGAIRRPGNVLAPAKLEPKISWRLTQGKFFEHWSRKM